MYMVLPAYAGMIPTTAQTRHRRIVLPAYAGMIPESGLRAIGSAAAVVVSLSPRCECKKPVKLPDVY